MTQIETYHQRYRFCTQRPKRAAVIINNVFGLKNKAAIEERCPGCWQFYVDIAMEDRFRVAGHIMFTFSPSPTDKRFFFVEGWGRHMFYDVAYGALFGMTSFRLDGSPLYSVRELRQGSVTVRILQETVREFEADRKRFAHPSEAYIKVHIVTLGQDVYAIDYNAEHEIGLPEPLGKGSNGERLEVHTVGYLQFDKPADAKKLIDLGKIGFVSSDYRKALAKEAIHGGGERVIHWLPEPPCPDDETPR